MLRKYRNALLDVIKEADFNPAEFTPMENVIDGYQAFQLKVGHTPLMFIVRTMLESEGRMFDYKYTRYVRKHPAPLFPANANVFSQWTDFETIKRICSEWLNTSVRMYLDDKAEEEEDRNLPDLWAELHLSTGSVIDTQTLQNTSFSVGEQMRIADSLTAFEREVQKHEILSSEQFKLLHEQVEYLVESSKRMGRKDWLAAAAGTLIGYTFQASLSSEAATQIVHLAGDALRWIAHTPLLLS